MVRKVTTDTTKERVMGGSNSKSTMENITVKVIDLQHEINNDIDNLVDMKVKINKWIENLGDINQQLVLEMRYLNRMSWDTIAVQLNYSQRTIFTMHKKGLLEIEKVCSKFQ